MNFLQIGKQYGTYSHINIFRWSMTVARDPRDLPNRENGNRLISDK